MNEKIAVVVTDLEDGEPSMAFVARALGFKVEVPRTPTIEAIVRRAPDLIIIDWSPGSIAANTELVGLIRSTGAIQRVPILASYSDRRDVPKEIWSVDRLVALALPAMPDVVERSLRQIADNVLPSPTRGVSPVPVAGSVKNSEAWLLDRLRAICTNFREVISPLCNRRAGKSPFELNDEYDIHDVLHVALRSVTDDVRAEEPGSSFAGAGSIRDFYVPSIETIVEAKRVRDASHGRRGVVDELIADKKRYGMHGRCRRIICLIFDPDRHVPNTAVLKSDLEEETGVPVLEVYVVR